MCLKDGVQDVIGSTPTGRTRKVQSTLAQTGKHYETAEKLSYLLQ